MFILWYNLAAQKIILMQMSKKMTKYREWKTLHKLKKPHEYTTIFQSQSPAMYVGLKLVYH